MMPPPALQEIPLNKGQVWGGEALEPGKLRAKRASATSVTGSEKSEALYLSKGRMSLCFCLFLAILLLQTLRFVLE
jgi:hypothetical protein